MNLSWQTNDDGGDIAQLFHLVEEHVKLDYRPFVALLVVQLSRNMTMKKAISSSTLQQSLASIMPDLWTLSYHRLVVRLCRKWESNLVPGIQYDTVWLWSSGTACRYCIGIVWLWSSGTAWRYCIAAVLKCCIYRYSLEERWYGNLSDFVGSRSYERIRVLKFLCFWNFGSYQESTIKLRTLSTSSHWLCNLRNDQRAYLLRAFGDYMLASNLISCIK